MKATKRGLLEFLIARQGAGKRVVGYGAPAKGNTLLNYCGVRSDLLDYTVDRSPHKQGRFLPGTHIPIYAPERIMRDPARLRADPAVEPQGRDRGADGRHPRLGRALRRADPRGEGARLKFTPTPLGGAFVVELERLEDERGFFARSFCQEEFRAHGLRPGDRAVQRLVQPPPRHAARPALPGRAARGGEARALHARARSAT